MIKICFLYTLKFEIYAKSFYNLKNNDKFNYINIFQYNNL